MLPCNSNVCRRRSRSCLSRTHWPSSGAIGTRGALAKWLSSLGKRKRPSNDCSPAHARPSGRGGMMTDPKLEREFSRLLSDPEEIAPRAPSSLTARLYSMLIHEQQASGPLASLDSTVAAGHGICVWEKLVQIT